MPVETHVRLPGSTRARKQDAERVGGIDGDTPVEVTLTLRRRGNADPTAHVKRVLARFGLGPVREFPITGSLVVRGTAAQVESAFQPGLGLYRSERDGEYRGREGAVKIPAELKGSVTGVFGLDTRPTARRTGGPDVAQPDAAAGGKPLTPKALERRYAFPPGRGEGQTIAIAEFGGGYFRDDVELFCRRHRRSIPDIAIVPIGGFEPLTAAQIAGLPQPQQPAALGMTREVMMDVQIVAGLCPNAHLKVFYAPFGEKGWIDLLDEVVATDPPPVSVSVSWGLAEDAPDWSSAGRTEINHRLRIAAGAGITVCAATGDDGSGDQMRDSRAHVHFPASSPFVLAVGGTMLDPQTGEEVGWWSAPGDRRQHGGGATGGGVSVKFKRPRWQAVQVKPLNPSGFEGRVVPDVAGLAGPPGYSLVFQGRPTFNGGTSAAAPLWAALIARIAAARGPAGAPGFLAPLLYAQLETGRVRGRATFTDVTKGRNRSPQPGFGYRARVGFDAVSGWGVPHGQRLLASL